MQPVEHLHKEIDNIQACIVRMSTQSHHCKGWLVTIIIAALALLPANIQRHNICLIIGLATLCFWWMDAYYLQREKLYRWKYEWVIYNRLKNNLEFLYDLNPMNKNMWNGHTEKELSMFKLMLWNPSTTVFYGGIFFFAAVMYYKYTH